MDENLNKKVGYNCTGTNRSRVKRPEGSVKIAFFDPEKYKNTDDFGESVDSGLDGILKKGPGHWEKVTKKYEKFF